MIFLTLLCAFASRLNSSKLTFQHQVKLQEPSVGFNCASLSQNYPLNTTRICYAHLRLLALLVVILGGTKGGNNEYQPLALLSYISRTFKLMVTFEKVLSRIRF